MNLLGQRRVLIEKVIKAHNIHVIFWNRNHPDMTPQQRWSTEDLEDNFDRFYLVEGCHENSWNTESDKKTYEPRLEVRRLLRSAEARKYGQGHQAFYDRYLNTISFTYEDLDDLDGLDAKMQHEWDKMLEKHKN